MDIPSEKKRIEIFCCYARQDQSLLLNLKKHLKLWERQSLITLWSDTDISPGTNWEKEITQHLKTAHIILFLVSPDFLASDYCYSKEVQRAMARYERGEVCVIPIILRHCVWEDAPFAKLEALPKGAKPVVGSSWHNQDEALTDVARDIGQMVKALTQSSQQKGGKDFLAETQLTYEAYPDQLQQISNTSDMLDRSKPVRQGISRRSVLGSAIALIGGGTAVFLCARLLTQSQSSQKPLVGTLNPAINSSGTMFGFDPQHTHFNPDEHVLSPTSVSRLVPYWTASTGNSIHSSPIIAKGVVYIGSDKLYAFNAVTGQTLWTASTEGLVNSSPAVANGVVYVGSYDHRVYAFHLPV